MHLADFCIQSNLFNQFMPYQRIEPIMLMLLADVVVCWIWQLIYFFPLNSLLTKNCLYTTVQKFGVTKSFFCFFLAQKYFC